MRLGYFTVDHKSSTDVFDFSWLNKQIINDNKTYTTCYELDYPLRIKIDGTTGMGVILKPKAPELEPMNEQETSGI